MNNKVLFKNIVVDKIFLFFYNLSIIMYFYFCVIINSLRKKDGLFFFDFSFVIRGILWVSFCK